MITAPLIVSLLISSGWLAYIAFYNSRVQGLVFTWILRHLGYIKDAEVKFGSISISILGGKVMFRELKYITKDYALRSVDGAFIFKWFTRLSPDDISRGAPDTDTDSSAKRSESQTWSLYHIIFQSRALLTLHGLEMHFYNRTKLYDDLEKLAKTELDVGMPEEQALGHDAPAEADVDDNKHSDKWGLRNLIPVLVVEVQKGKFVVGNNLTESVMFVDMESATAIYSTPSSKKQQLDPYMHMIRSKINKIRITFNKSPGYKGLQETPPSQPDAVPFLRSREVRVHYIQDMPGRVTSLQKSDESSPEWEMTVKFMRETVMHYGPWLDRQRDILYKFFYPYDYKVAEVSKPLKVGDLRRHQHMNVIIDFEANATLTILFFREETTSSINLNIANGSRIQMQIPWTVTPQGFTTQIVCDLYKVECQTSMDYRPLLDAEEVHAMFQFQYPRVWHHRQSWECDFFSVTRPTLHFVFDHVAFITDLLDDWGPPVQPDLQTFVPYVWRFDFKFTDALIVLPVSQHNWVDCIQNKLENSETVFFGLHCEMLDVHFELPWTNFQPITTEMRFDFNAEEIVGSLWLPKYHTLRDSLKQFNMGKIPAWLGRRDKFREENGSSAKEKETSPHDLEGWEECWSLQDLFLRFTFLNNSVIPYKKPANFSLPTEEKTNHLGVEVMLGPSVLRLHGVFFRHLWFFKDNYFGYDDKCTPLAVHLHNRPLDKTKSARVKRPCAQYPIYDLDITCKVIVKDILAEFPRHCTSTNEQIKLPCAQLDEIVFELWKTRHEAKMELTVSPVTILCRDGCKRPILDMHLSHGFLQLKGVKVLMCGLYSGVGIDNPKNPFDFLEYGFLVEVTTGALVGRVTLPHLQQITHWLEIFLWQALDRENEMPITEHQIGIERTHSQSHKFKNKVETENSSAIKEYHSYKFKASQQKKIKTEDLKYLMIKVSVAYSNVYIVESGCACHIATKSVRVALCNAHDETSTLGITVVIQGADVTQYVRLSHEEERYEIDHKSQWLEAGVLSLPPIMFDVNKRLGNPNQYKEEQREFLKTHDKINQCLLFLWHPEEYKGCGCVGGVTFNNTTLIEINGFYFEPVNVPADFCQSASTSTNTPWKAGRVTSQIAADGSASHTSPGSSVSSRQSDMRQHVNELLTKEGFGGLSPRLPSGSSDGKKKSPTPGKKKDNKSRDSGEWFTTFPQRSGARKRDKQNTLSHYNDLLRNFSIKRNISRLSSKRKSKDSEGATSVQPVQPAATAKTAPAEVAAATERAAPTEVAAADEAPDEEEQGEIDVDAELDKVTVLEEDVNSSNPSICVTTDIASAPEETPAEKLSIESLKCDISSRHFLSPHTPTVISLLEPRSKSLKAITTVLTTRQHRPTHASPSSFSGNKTSFNGNKTSFSGNKTSFSGNKTSFSGNKTSFSGNKTSFSENKTSFSENKTSFSGNKTSFSGNKTAKHPIISVYSTFTRKYYESAQGDEVKNEVKNEVERKISNAEYTVPPQSPVTDEKSTLGRRSRSGFRGGTLSRTSSQDSFHSAKSGWRDGTSSTNEEQADTSDQEADMNEPVKDLSIPFPFPKAADSALNHELVDIYRDHLPRAWLTETRFSNTVVLNRSFGDMDSAPDANKLPHRIASHEGRGSEEAKPSAVAPSIHQLLQIVRYILPDFQSEGAIESSVTSGNLFSSDAGSADPEPKLLELRNKWEKKLKEKKVSCDESSVEADGLEKDGKVLLIAEVADPVDLFFTPFCVHAVNKYIETAETFYRNLPPAAVINLVQAAAAPTVLEIAIQHATAQRALLFSNHLQPVTMKKFDNSLERTIEERLNLELFLSIPTLSIRTLQGGGDLQWVGTETELETARSKTQAAKDAETTSTEDEGQTDRSGSARSDEDQRSSGVGSSVICPNKVAKLSLVKFVANNIDVSFSYQQFERQRPAGSGSKNKSVLESMPPGEYTQTAFRASVDGVYGQLHILHPLSERHSDTFIPYSKTRVTPATIVKDNVQKLSSRETSIVFEFGAEKCCLKGGSLKRNQLVALPELPSETQQPKKKEEEEAKQDIESFAMDEDSVDIELGVDATVAPPFKYKKIRSRASIHYHSGPDRMSMNSSLLDEAQEPLISDDNSSSEDVLTNEGIEYKHLESDKEDDVASTTKTSVGADVSASMTEHDRKQYHDKSSINGNIAEFWIQIATPSEEQTDSDLFNPYSSLPHAVFSWSEPGSLLFQHAAQLAHLKLSRVQSVMSVLLAEALGQETQYEPPNYTTKYSRLTIASKTLKESAVIRLMNQLRYTLSATKDVDALNRDLIPDFVPRRIMLERGVQAMLVVIEGNILQTTDNVMDSMSTKSTISPHTTSPLKDPADPFVTDKTPVYYLGKQDYGSIAALDKISIGKPPQNMQSDAKHRTHRHALIEMLSSSDRAKLADKYFSLYQALQIRLPKTDHVNHQLTLTICETSITAIDCHRDVGNDQAVNPLVKAMNLSLETSLFPAKKDFSTPKPIKESTHRRNDSRSSTGVLPSRTLHRSESASSVYSSKQSYQSKPSLPTTAANTPSGVPSSGAPPTRPPRKRKTKKMMEHAQKVKKSISHVVKHLVINTQIETCVTEINLDMLRLSKAVVDGMSNFQPGSFHPVFNADSTIVSESVPSSPTLGEPPLRSVEDQFVMSGAWERMNEYIQLMFRGEYGRRRASGDPVKRWKPQIDRDIMLYSESPYIPLSVTASWRFDKSEIVGRLQGLRTHINVRTISGTAAILQNLYVEMNNSPNSDIILEPLSPNVISGLLHDTTAAVHFYDGETEEDNELLCIDIPSLNAVYSFLPHVTRIQKMFINVAELKAKVPKPIVEIKNVLLISTKLVLHEIKSFDRYFQRYLTSVSELFTSKFHRHLKDLSTLFHFPQSHTNIHRPQQSLQRIHIESLNKQNDIDLNLVIRSASFDLYLLPSLSLKHEIEDLHMRFAQSKSLTAQLDIHHHELSLDAGEVDLHTHLPLPQIFIRGEKVKTRDPVIRAGPGGDQYTGSVEIKTFQLHLPTTMLNHVLLVQNAFMKEINEFLDTITMIRNTIEKTSALQRPSTFQTSPHMVPFAFSMKLQGIDLLATTPSDLAMSLKTETINVEIKNRMKTEHIMVAKDRQQIIERPRMFISTTITTDITLGQLADIAPGVPRSSEEDMVKFLQFRATASLGNDEGLFENKLSSSESFHATISNPQLFMQPGAFDKALLFYLNYKCAYSIFNDERQKLNSEAVSATETFKNRFNLPEGPPVLPTNTHLKVIVKNVAVCLPIQRNNNATANDDLLSASQTDLVKYSEGALSISIKTAEMMMSFGAMHLNKGHFNDFVIRFIDDFDEKRWTENAAPRSSEKVMNSIAIDTGNYYFTTVTTSPNIQSKDSTLASESEQSGKMTVCVSSDIKGVNIHLSTGIISKLVGVYKTLTSIVGADDAKDDEPLIDETELVKNLGAQHAERGKFNEVEAVKIWKRTALLTKDKKEVKNDKDGGGKRKKHSEKLTEPEKEKKLDEISMFSTKTSKSIYKHEEDGTTSSVGSSTQHTLLEPPLLEFEMDLDIRLGNGKITLYPISKTDESFTKKGRFERFNEAQDFVTDNTELLIPETKCELHYSSTKITEKGSSHSGVTSTGTSVGTVSRLSADTTGTTGSGDSSSKAVKTGTLYTTITVMSLKQDQIIRPCFLEYLNQLLSKEKDSGGPPQSAAEAFQTFIPEEIEEILREPKKSRAVVEEPKSSPSPSSEHSGSGKPNPTDTFPVDIIVLVLVEPSTIKLSCQPFSRHECSLVVPRSHVLLSTKGTPSQPILTVATGRKEVPVTRDGSTSCWNLTWCLNQCKLSLYHPLSALPSYQTPQGLPSRAEVRNALSVTVDGGNIHITRITTPKELLNSDETVIPGHNPKRLVAHVSSMLDLGKISLTYDIKRMDEVESFHHAWLSGQFIKRLLLLSRPPTDLSPQETTSPPVPSSPVFTAPERPLKSVSRNERFYSLRGGPTSERPFAGKREVSSLRHMEEDTEPSTSSHVSITPTPLTSAAPPSTITTKSSDSTEPEIAETNLILAINSKDITLTTNLGHTLGRINISITDSKNTTTLCLKERHNERRKVDVLVGGVLMESTAGLITGLVRLENLAGVFEHFISPDLAPTHSIKINLESFENKIEYLSNCIYMLRLTQFCTQLNDMWREGDCDLRVGGSISWDVIQTMVNCNTAPNLVQIKAHLDEFVLHQKKYSQRAYLKLLNLDPEEKEKPQSAPLKQYELEAQFLAYHWFWAVSPHSSFEGIKVLLESGRFVKPIRLGGSLKLSGEQVSVAVFQGEKFRDDTWALVNLSKVRMKYETQVEEFAKGGTGTGRVTKQQAVICMGDFEPEDFAGLHVKASNNSIGTVEKCVRSTKLSPPERTDDMRKWLQYACTHDFAHGNPDKDRNTRATIFGGGSVEFSTIFQMPESMLNLTTEHNWEGSEQGSPMSTRSLHHLPIPVVNCNLKSHFRGAIGLATNAGNYFFLHDLAQRYTKKMEIYMEANPIFAFEKKAEPGHAAAAPSSETDDSPKYGREFVCDEWELKPPLRLQGGGKVEVNVDWVLNKLGFKNPTVTIPKWIQRGPMDPLDFLVSGLVKSLVFQQAEIVSEQKGLKKS